MKMTVAPKELRRQLREKINIIKVSRLAVVINCIQILAALLIILLAFIRKGDLISGNAEILMLFAMGLIVTWGAVVDIREAVAARRMVHETNMLEYANAQLETLNRTLRAQRHDFMNHLQVVYSLMELDDHEEAMGYIERVYGDIQRVGRTLKTSIPAVNALLAAKLSDCEERGIAVELKVESDWEDLPVSGWEMCRVLGNLLDNAMDALKETENPQVIVTLNENIHHYTFSVKNNGPMISKDLQSRIFGAGFSTKGDERGMGLAIVRRILESKGGRISVSSNETRTLFKGEIRKVAQSASDNV